MKFYTVFYTVKLILNKLAVCETISLNIDIVRVHFVAISTDKQSEKSLHLLSVNFVFGQALLSEKLYPDLSFKINYDD